MAAAFSRSRLAVLTLSLILLASGTPQLVSQVRARDALVAQALVIQTPSEDDATGRIGVPPSPDEFHALDGHTASNANPAYPYNHTFDADAETLGTSPTNSGFESASTTTGTPPANHDFASGDLTSWTTTGTVSTATDTPHGTYASLGTSAVLTSAAFTVGSAAQGFVVDIGYLTTSGAASVTVHVLTGATYATATQLGFLTCTACNSWETRTFDASAYQGQSVKLRFTRGSGTVGIDAARSEEFATGYTLSGAVSRVVESGNGSLKLDANAIVTTAAFTVASDAQFGAVTVSGLSGGADNYSTSVLSDAGYATTTQVAFNGSAPDSWTTVRFNLVGWRGGSIKLKVQRFGGSVGSIFYLELLTMTDPREITVTYGYDDAGNQTSLTNGTDTITFDYDLLSRRTEMVDDTGTTSWDYDPLGRVTEVAAPNGTVSYSYDDAGQRTSMTIPGARTVTYGYDAAGQMTSLTDWESRQTTFTYNDAGQRTAIHRPNDVTTTYGYDDAGWLESIDHEDATTTLESFEYTLDVAGNRTAVESSDGTETYVLDALNRITSVTYPNSDVITYTYDSAGNRLTQTLNTATTATYTYDDSGKLTNDGTNSYVYDDAGNLTAAGTSTFQWDWLGRMTEATVNSVTESYEYDGTGLRTSTTANAATVESIWDRQNYVPLVVSDNTYGYLHADGLLARIDAGSTDAYYLTDALGSVRRVTDESGDVIETSDFDVFGAVRDQTGTPGAFGFTGEQTDTITGLTYLRARYLSPDLWRMLSADAVQPSYSGTQGWNHYAYVANNPTTLVDPTGHLTIPLPPPGPPLLWAIILIVIFIMIVVPILLCYLSGECSLSGGGPTDNYTDPYEAATITLPDGSKLRVRKLKDSEVRRRGWLEKRQIRADPQQMRSGATLAIQIDAL